MAIVSPRTVQAALVLRGWSYSTWATERGHKPDTVRRVVRRWAGRMDRTPYGVEARRILADLSRDTGIAIVPGIAPSQAKPTLNPGREAA